MAITLKAFHFVLYSLLIYSFFRDKLTRTGAEDPEVLGRKENSVGRQERDILILNERLTDTSNSRERFRRELERKYDSGKAEFHVTIDDEDGDRELEEKSESGSGDSMNIQGDEPASSRNNSDQLFDAPNPKINTTSVQVIAPSNTSTVIVSTTASLRITSIVVATTSSIHDANTIIATATTATPILITASNTTTDEPNTIYMEASVFSSVQSTFRTAIITISSIHNTRASVQPSAVAALGTSTALPTKRPSTASTTEGNNVQNQREPKGKKTLFGFVTVEILVALLAGALCAVILLIFLVHRLKKRNEGSYELQEMLMLKSGGYVEEKEVFV